MIGGMSMEGRGAAGGLQRGGRRRVWVLVALVWVVMGGGALALAQSETIPPDPGMPAPWGGPYPAVVLTLAAGVLFVLGAPAMARAEVFDRHWWKQARALDGARRRRLGRCVRAVRAVAEADREAAVVVARAALFLDRRLFFILGFALLLLGEGLHTGVAWQVVVMVVTAALLLVAVVTRHLAVSRVHRWLSLHAHPSPAESLGLAQ